MQRRIFKRFKLARVGLMLAVSIFCLPHVQAEGSTSEQVKRLSDVAVVTAGERSVYAVKKDGTVWAWGGSQRSGLLGNGYPVQSESPVQMKIDNVSDAAGGTRHALLLKKDGTVWAVGSNEDGQLGLGTASNDLVLAPVQIESLSDVTAIAAEGNQSLALKSDGTVWQWGRTDRVSMPSYKPVKVEGLPAGAAIAAGYGSAMMLDTGGNVYVWGTALTETNPDKLRKPTMISGLNKKVTAIAASGNRAAALAEDGTVWTWNNSKMYPTPGQLLQPTKVLQAEDVQHIAGGNGTSFGLTKKDGTVWMWYSYWDQPTYKAVQILGINDALHMASSRFWGNYALLKNGTLMEWKTDTLGEFSKPKPVQAPIQIKLNGEIVPLVIPPVIINNVSYVPLRGVFEPIGAKVEWNQGNFTGVVKKGKTVIEIYAASEKLRLNGQIVPDKFNPKMMNGVTMVPLRFISESLGAEVRWNGADNIIHINIP